MKRIIAIVAGGDSSEHDVSMRSAEGIYSFIDKDKYTLYIVELTKEKWEALLPDGSRAQIDRNDFSFSHDGQKVKPDFAYITIHGTPRERYPPRLFRTARHPLLYVRRTGIGHDIQ